MIKVPHSTLLCDIDAHATNTPDKIALVEGDTRITYSQLASRIKTCASFLQTLGLQAGDRILLSAQKEQEFIYVYFAAHLLGIVNVVVDSAAPRERLDYIIGVVKPVVCFGDAYQGGACRWIPFGDVPQEESQGVLEVPQLHSTDVADVMFTTGTTGAPKGVCLSHANISGSAYNTNGFIGTQADDIEALALPLSHSFGLGRLRCVFSVGATLVLVSNFANLKHFFTVLEKERVTGFGMVPAAWQYIKRFSGRRIGKFADQLRYIEIGSAAMPIEDKQLLMELFPTTRVCMHYGLTEASRALFSEFHANANNLDSVGRPASALVEVRVLDEKGKQLDPGIDGEICVRGNMVCCSYYLDKDNESAFYGEWFRTGDWGHQDEDGNFYLTGRKKELINVGGEKVSPATIEDAIMSLGLKDCACVAVNDPNGVLGEVPKAFLVKGDADISIDDIKHRLVQLLPPHEIPVEWEWIDSIPRTLSGKIQRLKLKQ
jgi:long-chain acyl-CoA synthetase